MAIHEFFNRVDFNTLSLEFGIAGVDVVCEGFNKKTRFYTPSDSQWPELLTYFVDSRYTQKPEQIRIIGDEVGEEIQPKLALLTGLNDRGKKFLSVVAIENNPQDIMVKLGSNYRHLRNLPFSVYNASDYLATEYREAGKITITKQDGKYMIEAVAGQIGQSSRNR
jgi:hypothetical protein